jgi:hypothetical protein
MLIRLVLALSVVVVLIGVASAQETRAYANCLTPPQGSQTAPRRPS